MMAACGATRAILESQFMVDLFVMNLQHNAFERSFPSRGSARPLLSPTAGEFPV